MTKNTIVKGKHGESVLIQTPMSKTYEQMRQAEPAEALEALIDVHGIARIIEILGNVCDEKSNHISTNSQDYNLASKWSNVGRKLHKLQFPVL